MHNAASPAHPPGNRDSQRGGQAQGTSRDAPWFVADIPLLLPALLEQILPTHSVHLPAAQEVNLAGGAKEVDARLVAFCFGIVEGRARAVYAMVRDKIQDEAD